MILQNLYTVIVNRATRKMFFFQVLVETIYFIHPQWALLIQSHHEKNDVVLLLLLPFNRYSTLFWYFHCWLRTTKFRLGRWLNLCRFLPQLLQYFPVFCYNCSRIVRNIELTLSWQKSLLYRNQSIDLLCIFNNFW